MKNEILPVLIVSVLLILWQFTPVGNAPMSLLKLPHTKEKMFQTEMLKGKLPNGDSIAGAQARPSFYEEKYLQFANDPGHFDHFHLELQ